MTIHKNRNITSRLKAIIMIAFLFLISGIFSSGCKKSEDYKTESNDVLAKVYDKKLTKNDIDIEYIKNISKEDSLNLVHSFIEHWIRKELLAHNAKKYINNKKEIERLVEDYEKSLLVEAFQKQYIQENLDTNITKKQMKEFYDENKENFHLDHSIVRFLYAKIDAKEKGIDKFYENWNNNRYNLVYRYGSKKSKKYFLKTKKWYDLKEMKKEIPHFLYKKDRKYEVQKNVNGYEYFLKVLETRYNGEIVPLSLIKDKLKVLIIEKRKSHLIDDYIEKLYKKEINNNNIKIYK
ncbi:MAG TPA: hypothetical protein ENI82_06440 [Bacteroidetes bacterium]|nr:hypothetical protein [Bacteroidota bacterium]